MIQPLLPHHSLSRYWRQRFCVCGGLKFKLRNNSLSREIYDVVGSQENDGCISNFIAKFCTWKARKYLITSKSVLARKSELLDRITHVYLITKSN